MSPRRRALLVVVAVVVGAVVAAVAVRALRDQVRSVPAQDRPGAVLLVPGFGGGTAGLAVLADRLRAAGRTATVVRLPGNGTGDLAEQARVLDGYVADAMRRGGSVDIVGHSAGGVVARVWAQEHDGAHKARRVVTLGSPHHGATIAAAGVAAGSAACPTACQQLAPGSRLLAGLRTPVPTPPRWLSVWTDRDETVTPPDSARLDGAVNVTVQSLCPESVVSHGGLPTDPLVTALVLAALGPDPLTAPTGPPPATCVHPS